MIVIDDFEQEEKYLKSVKSTKDVKHDKSFVLLFTIKYMVSNI